MKVKVIFYSCLNQNKMTTPNNETVAPVEPQYQMVPDTEECSICIENFTNVKRKKVVCAKCNYSCCKQCCQEYLISTTNEPQCPNCKTLWDNEFLYENLTKSYMNTTYRKHKTELLFQIEKARIPEMMPAVELYKNLSAMENEAVKLYNQMQEIKKQYNTLQGQINFIKNGNFEAAMNGAVKENKDRRAFIHKCPVEGCNGFLSAQWKCAVCSKYTCKDCLELIGDHKDEPHTCNEDSVKSAQMIKKDSRPCPKCAVPIFKINGCDQMWCTQCHVTFSWNTGKVSVGGNVHNPHYFQFLNQGGVLPRNPGDQVCGGLVDTWRLNTQIKNVSLAFNQFVIILKGDETYKKYIQDGEIIEFANKNLTSEQMTKQSIITSIKKDKNLKLINLRYLTEILRGVRHNLYILNRIRAQVNRQDDNTIDRIKYIVDEYSESKFKSILSKQNVKRNKNHRILQILELVNVVCTDNFNQLQEYLDKFIVDMTKKAKSKQLIKNFEKNIKDIDTTIGNFYQIRTYCNDEFAKIAKQYNNKPMILNDNMQLNTY